MAIRVGMIGCGGRAGAHMNSFLQMQDVQVVAVADPIEERRKNFAAKLGAQRAYRDHKEFYASEDGRSLDVIYIDVEPTAHDEIMELRAVERGIPFFVEKPMTLDLSLAERIARGVEEKGLLTSVGFQDRYLDLVNMIKDELPKHKMGGLVYGAWCGGIPGVWWWQKKSTCGGQLVEQNIHLLDGLRYLFGEPLSIYATSSRGIVQPGVTASAEYDTDDHSTAVLRFSNNFTATLVSSCYSAGVRPNCGYVISLQDMIIDYRLRNNIIFTTEMETRDIKRGHDQTYSMDRAFIDAIKTGDAGLIRSPYSDALKSLNLGFAANESMETGKVIYF